MTTEFVKAARYILRSRMVKRAYVPGGSASTQPFSPDYNPLKGAKWRPDGTVEYSSYPPGTKEPSLEDMAHQLRTPFKRTIFEMNPSVPKRQNPYKNSKRWGHGASFVGNDFTDRLHEKLFNLPADTQQIYWTDQQSIQDNEDTHEKNKRVGRDAFNQYEETFRNYGRSYWQHILERYPALTGQLKDWGRKEPLSPWEVEDNRVDTGMIDNNGQPVYGELDSDVRDSLLQQMNMIDNNISKYAPNKEDFFVLQDRYDPAASFLEKEKRWLANRKRLYATEGPTAYKAILPQKHKVMQQYIDNSNVAKAFRAYPSIPTAAAYYGYKALPWLWPSNWSPENAEFADDLMRNMGHYFYDLVDPPRPAYEYEYPAEE